MSPVSRPLGSTPFGGTGAAAFSSAGLQVLIGTDDVTAFVVWGSFRMEHELSGRDQCECQLLNDENYLPLLGAPVVVLYRGGVIFTGSVHEREAAFEYTPQNISYRIDVRCVDLNALADRRFVSEVYENMTAGDIVRALVVKYFQIESIHQGNIQPGPIINKVVFPRISFAACLDSLCERAGFYWNIDSKRFLNFFPRTFSPAPFTITSVNAVFRNMHASMSMNQYRNVEYVAGGKGVTDARTESFRGDGTVKSFNTEYKISEKPLITLNGVEETVGIRGIDEDKIWYWSKGETSIGQDSLHPTLTASDLLFVTYRGEFSLVQVVEDAEAIIDRQELEGGSGRYEHLVQDSTLDGSELVQGKGLALLRRFGTLDHLVTFETYIEGLTIGQNVTINVPEFELGGEFLITQMETRFILPTLRRFTVTATNGEIKNKFQDFFARLLSSTNPVNISEEEILQEVTARHDLVGVTDSITADLITATVDEFGTGEAGTAEFGA